MFIVALVTIARTWEQPRGVAKEDVAHTYNAIVLAIETNEIMPYAATWVVLRFCHTE